MAAKLAGGRKGLRWEGRWGRKEEISGPAAGKLFYAACATEPFFIAQKNSQVIVPTIFLYKNITNSSTDRYALFIAA